ncbi:hypothetical protein BJY59DRAFT_710698 [Rhodotorula toruloides]
MLLLARLDQGKQTQGHHNPAQSESLAVVDQLKADGKQVGLREAEANLTHFQMLHISQVNILPYLGAKQLSAACIHEELAKLLPQLLNQVGEERLDLLLLADQESTVLSFSFLREHLWLVKVEQSQFESERKATPDWTISSWENLSGIQVALQPAGNVKGEGGEEETDSNSPLHKFAPHHLDSPPRTLLSASTGHPKSVQDALEEKQESQSVQGKAKGRLVEQGQGKQAARDQLVLQPIPPALLCPTTSHKNVTQSVDPPYFRKVDWVHLLLRLRVLLSLTKQQASSGSFLTAQ